ncbi:MAG: heme exporter protein CcmD [Hahellaceae bacterium]|nr:heme exporter protein CcmD [Hahellaceae bacterium]
MPFESFSAFLQMGGHGLYVWLAYGVGAAFILYNLIAPRLRNREIRQQIARQLSRDEEERA